jgi:NAD(P)-dependent dehydrogenase (short-subunit alcohol dehydrogenase family)
MTVPPDDAMSAARIFDVRGSVAIVTGASSGLGERFTRVLATNGATVIAVARRVDRLHALAAELPSVEPHPADLSIEAERAALIDAVVERHGRIDVLVNNAGYGHAQPAVDEPIADFRAVLELNLVALFELSRLAARSMIAARRGSIINIASVLGLVASTPIPNGSYSASKGAVINLTRELGCQWARHRVRVNAIAPGFFPTESTEGMEPGTPGGDFVVNGCPMRRLGEPHELDGALLFLASDASTYCTGQVLTVDGGWTAR